MRHSGFPWGGGSISASRPVWVPGPLKYLQVIPGRMWEASGVLGTPEGCFLLGLLILTWRWAPAPTLPWEALDGASKQIHLEIEKYSQHWQFCLGLPTGVWNRPMKGALRSSLGRLWNQGLGTPSTSKYLHPGHCKQYLHRERVCICWS